MKKIILIPLYLIMLSLTIASALAITPYPTSNPYNANHGWRLNGDANAFIGSIDGSLGGTGCVYSSNTSLGSGQSLDCDGSGYFNTGVNNITTNAAWTMCYWIKIQDPNVDGNKFQWGVLDTEYIGVFETGTNQWQLTDSDGALQDSINTNSGYTAQEQFSLWCNVHSAGSGADKLNIYINATDVATTANSDQGVAAGTPTQSIYFLARNNAGSADLNLNAQVDEILFFHHALSQSEIDTIYNGNYSTAPSNFTITAQDKYDGSSINNLSVTIGAQTYTTESGSITTNILSNDTSSYNFTVNSNSSGGYFNQSFLNYNVSTDLTAIMYQVVVNFTAQEKITNFTITGGSFHNPLSNVSNGNLTYLKAGLYNITFQSPNYYNRTIEFNFSNLDNVTKSINGVYNSILNVSVRSLINGGLVNNHTTNFTVSGYTYQEQKSTTSQYIAFNIIKNLTYNLTSLPVNHQLLNASVLVNNISFPYQFLAYTSNSFNFTFYNETTGERINSDVTVEFISNAESYNYTASNGTLYVDLITPSDYTIRYKSDDYGRIRSYFLTLTNNSHTDLNLYLIHNSVSTETTVTVYDKTKLTPVSGAVVYLQRYFQTDNTYRTVAMYESDVAGINYFDIEHDNEYYKFIVDYPWKNQKLVTDKLYVSSTSINLYIPLIDAIAENFYNENNLIGDLTYNNNTQEFTATWNDVGLLYDEFCLDIKVYGKYSKQLLNRSCSSSSSGSIVLGGLQANSTNYATFSVRDNDKVTVIDTEWADLYDDRLDVGSLGAFSTVLLYIGVIIVSGLSIFGMIAGVAVLFFAKLLGFILVDWGYLYGLMLLSFIIGIVLEMKRR